MGRRRSSNGSARYAIEDYPSGWVGLGFPKEVDRTKSESIALQSAWQSRLIAEANERGRLVHSGRTSCKEFSKIEPVVPVAPASQSQVVGPTFQPSIAPAPSERLLSPGP